MSHALSRSGLRNVFLWLPIAALLVACGTGSEGKETAAYAGTALDNQSELPPGHPPVSPDQSSMAVPAPLPGASGSEAGLSWQTPEGWVEEPPSNSMRRAQYRVSGPGGDAECVVFYFGPGQGGDVQSNAARWASQFTQPDGGSSLDRMKTESIEVGDVPVLLVEVSGTYSGGSMMGPPKELADHLLLGAIAEGGDSNWFFKFTGPADTVEAQREAFHAMIESLRRGSDFT